MRAHVGRAIGLGLLLYLGWLLIALGFGWPPAVIIGGGIVCGWLGGVVAS